MEIDLKQVVGQRIRLQREASGMTQKMLAEKLNKKRSNIANYELGNVMPPGNIIRELADILGVSADFLLGVNELPIQREGMPSSKYLHLAKQAEEIGMPEEDVEFIIEIYKWVKDKR